MLRLVILFFILAVLAYGLGQLADQPGDISVNWGSFHIETSLLVGLLGLLATVVALSVLWSLIRFVFRIPALVTLASKARSRAKGFAAVSRGMVALGAGDQKTAASAAKEAEKHLKDEPLALLLKAQSAQMSGDKAAAETTFSKMAQNPATRVLGLRGLHVEARRRGDAEAAHAHAEEAQKHGATPWAAEALLDHHAANANWAAALAGVECSASARLIDKADANRQRAVLKTAIALDKKAGSPEEALKLAREAIGLSPNLVPATVLAAQLLIAQKDPRRARKLIEAIWPNAQHPDLAQAYVDSRPGDKASEKLARAEYLLKLTPDSADARLAVAKAAIIAREFDRAGEVLRPLVDLDSAERPTARACLAMAELEQARGSGNGRTREWLARAAHAPRDAAWIADGVISDTWGPVSPITGKLDAFHWTRPMESVAAYTYEAPAEVVETSLVPALVLAPPGAPDDPGLDNAVAPQKKRFGGIFR